MEQSKKTLEELLKIWSKVAWSNKDIMTCFDVGMTKASQIHQAAKRNKGLFRGRDLKSKVKSDAVCEMLGIDRQQEIKRILSYLN